MRLWRVALCFVKIKPTTKPGSQAKLAGKAGRPPSQLPTEHPPQELRVAPAATLAGTGDPVDKAWVQLWPPSLTLFSLE